MQDNRQLPAQASELQRLFFARQIPATEEELHQLAGLLKSSEAGSRLVQALLKIPAEEFVQRSYTLAEVLQQHYGDEGSCAQYPRTSWEKSVKEGVTSCGYLSWVAQSLAAKHGRKSAFAPTFKEYLASVATLSGRYVQWAIEPRLIQPDGRLDTGRQFESPGVAILALDDGLAQELRRKNFGENRLSIFKNGHCLEKGGTCELEIAISRKDGHFGTLFEAQYACGSIKARYRNDDFLERKVCHQDIHFQMLKAAQVLTKNFGWATFGVPAVEEIFQERPAIWGFTADESSVAESQKMDLASAMLELVF